MNDKTIKVLEFEKIIEQIKQEASTSLGQSAINDIQIETDIKKVQQLQDETDEAVHIYRLNERPPFSYANDVVPFVKRSEIGSMLYAEECVEIAQLLYCSRHLKNYISDHEEDLTHLKAYAEQIHPVQQLEKEIFRVIDEHGEIVDYATTALQSIRNNIRTSERRIRERLQQIIRSKGKMLSDGIITIRNNRYVLPVRHEYRQAIGGIVHDQSASGQTLFMEPQAITTINNELQQLFVKEKREIEKVLLALTSQIAEHHMEIIDNQHLIARLDSIFAKASYSMKMRGSKPKLNDQGVIDIKRGRHPLIDEDEVIANDIKIGDSYHAIVITGPNTGGKTVTLKMVGLFVLMAQAGMQIPALDGSEIAIYKNIFADIGDEQSIEQNLSTFSSHMTNIVQIMENVDNQTFVLFDELGAGTDPQEGAALAMAILDEVIDRQATVIATTHYPELKAYSYNREYVMNASVEFDVETLRPTYRLLLGIPGRSNAFEISRRLGLSDSLIDQAESYIGLDSKNVENMIQALEKTKKTAEEEAEEAHTILEESEQLRKEIEAEWKAFEQSRDKLYKKAEEKAQKAIEKARQEAEAIVESVRNMKNRAWKEHEWIEARKDLEEAEVALVKDDEKERVKKSNDRIEVGDEVKHLLLQQVGEIVEKKSDKEFVLQVGNMIVDASKDDIEFVRKGKQVIQEEMKHKPRVVKANQSFTPELDLRGERYEEAMIQAEKFIDDAIVNNYPRVTIIHGKGTGALRQGIHQYALQNKHISTFRLGGDGEGGSGVTIIELN